MAVQKGAFALYSEVRCLDLTREVLPHDPTLANLADTVSGATDTRRQPLILLNGLAEQAESWFRNHSFWGRHFEVYLPNLLVYDGPALHQRIDAGLPISVDYLVEQLQHYLESFVQTPPYHLVAASLGGKSPSSTPFAIPTAWRALSSFVPLEWAKKSACHRGRRAPQRSALDRRECVLRSQPRRSDMLRYYRGSSSTPLANGASTHGARHDGSLRPRGWPSCNNRRCWSAAATIDRRSESGGDGGETAATEDSTCHFAVRPCAPDGTSRLDNRLVRTF